jgi:hypothetical protein
MAIGAVNTTAHASGLTRRQRYENVRGQLKTEQATFHPTWQELGEFWQPRRSRFFTSDRNKGDRRSQSIIDSTPLFALRTLQAGMHAGLTSPARPWMRLTTGDPDLAERASVKQWLHIVTQRMLTIFLRSNLYNALPLTYGDMGLFGTAALCVMEDDDDLMRAHAYPIGSYLVGLDKRGIATTFSRELRLTCRQLIEEFGRVDGGRDIDRTKFSNEVLTAWDGGEYEQAFDITWFIAPNDEYDPTRLEARHTMRWKSCWYELGKEDKDLNGEGFLRESGFEEFPVFIPRWDVTGEDTYGTQSPALIAHGDVKQLQLMQKRKAQAIEKAINPPLVGPASLEGRGVFNLPGRVTYDDVREGMQGLRPLHQVPLEGLQYLLQDMGETRERIRQAMYADLWLMLSQSDLRQPITAEEVRARQEEKLIALGPVLERTNDELLDPMVDRVFAMMQRVGAVPEAPPELQGINLKVEYLSILAQAQKLVGVVGQDRFLQSVVFMAEHFPEVKHKVNAQQVVDRYGDMLGVAPSIIRSDEEAEASLRAEQEQIQAMQRAEQAKTLGAAAQSLGNTPLTPGVPTALSAVLDGVGAV